MPIEQKLERVPYQDHPDRCSGVGQHGQCPYFKVPGTKFCHRHGFNSQEQKQEAASLRLYRLSKWQNRVNEFADSEKVKSLREEQGILRVLLEEILNKCQDRDDLIMNSAKIADIVTRIEKLTFSMHKIETATGSLLDKEAVLHFATLVVQIISTHVTDPTVVDTIGQEVINAVTQSQTFASRANLIGA